MIENPYASPNTPTDFERPHRLDRSEMRIASQGRRFANMILDNIVLQLMLYPVGIVVGVVYNRICVASTGHFASEDMATLNTAWLAINLLVAFAYFVITEAVFQRTLAKFVTGTMVVTANGEQPSLGQIAGRSLARFIPFDALSFLGGNDPVGWHDSLSDTRVVFTPRNEARRHLAEPEGDTWRA